MLELVLLFLHHTSPQEATFDSQLIPVFHLPPATETDIWELIRGERSCSELSPGLQTRSVCLGKVPTSWNSNRPSNPINKTYDSEKYISSSLAFWIAWQKWYRLIEFWQILFKITSSLIYKLHIKECTN